MTDVATPENDLETLIWRVQGMDCAACVAKVEKAVKRLPGVSTVQVSLMAERLTISRTSEGAAPETVEKQVEALGYRTSRLTVVTDLETEHPELGCCSHDHAGHGHGEATEAATGHGHAHGDSEDSGENWWQTAKARLVAGLAVLVAAAWTLSIFLPREAYWIYLVATVAAVIPFGRRAVALARAGSPFSIETLMCTAALGAVAIGAAEEAAVVVLLFALGELLENVAAGRARAGIRALADLIPRSARLEGAAGAISDVTAARLTVGDIVQIRPGDRVPCDGEIIEGTSALDESPVTGESVPVSRGPLNYNICTYICPNRNCTLNPDLARCQA